MMNMHLKVMEIGTNSPVSSDADNILYADSEDDKGIPGHSSGVPIPGHTSSSDETVEIEIGQIPWHTSSGDNDDTIEIDVIREISWVYISWAYNESS